MDMLTVRYMHKESYVMQRALVGNAMTEFSAVEEKQWSHAKIPAPECVGISCVVHP